MFALPASGRGSDPGRHAIVPEILQQRRDPGRRRKAAAIQAAGNNAGNAAAKKHIDISIQIDIL